MVIITLRRSQLYFEEDQKEVQRFELLKYAALKAITPSAPILDQCIRSLF